MFRHLARRHDRKHIRKSLDRQERISNECVGFNEDLSSAFLTDETSSQRSEEFDLTSWSISEGEQFYAPTSGAVPLEVSKTSVTFQSEISTADDENNTFRCAITPSEAKQHAVIVFHHWYARNRHTKLSRFFASRGMTVVEATLPYHHHRGASDFSEEQFLSADLGGTIRSMRQAVLDGRKIVGWLHEEGYEKISVAGMCIGGTVAGLIAAHDERVDSAVLIVSPVSPADLVWTSETMHPLRGRIRPAMTLERLKTAWSIIDLEKYTFGLTRKGLQLMFVIAEDDTIARPEQSDWIIDFLNRTGHAPTIIRIGCGHSSVGTFPHSLIAAWRVLHFLKEWPTMRELWDLRLLILGIDLTEGPAKYGFFAPVARSASALTSITLYCVDALIRSIWRPRKDHSSHDA